MGNMGGTAAGGDSDGQDSSDDDDGGRGYGSQGGMGGSRRRQPNLRGVPRCRGRRGTTQNSPCERKTALCCGSSR